MDPIFHAVGTLQRPKLYIYEIQSWELHISSVNNVSQAPTNVPWARLESFKRSFVSHTCRLWNDLPDNVQDASSVYNFKHALYLDDNKPDTTYTLILGNTVFEETRHFAAAAAHETIINQ